MQKIREKLIDRLVSRNKFSLSSFTFVQVQVDKLRSRATLRTLVKTLSDIDKTCETTSQHNHLQTLASRFIEFFIFEFCFSSFAKPMEPKLIADFIMLLAERPLQGVEQDSIDIVPSAAGRVCLLRYLLMLKHPESIKLSESLLMAELQRSAEDMK